MLGAYGCERYYCRRVKVNIRRILWMLLVAFLLFGASVGAYLYHDHLKAQREDLLTQLSRLDQRIGTLEGREPNRHHWSTQVHKTRVVYGGEHPETNRAPVIF